ncbi:class I adenylate-forming enzyme family protein [Humidesulfovibrio idahonensis]
MPINRILESAATRSPDSIALRTADEAVSYGSLADQAARLAGGFARLGLAPGDRMAVLLPNSVALVTTALAACRLGLILVPLSRQYAPRQHAQILADTGARALVTSSALREAIPAAALDALCACILTDADLPGCVRHGALLEADAPPTAGTAADPLALIVYTSGTTGRPKGIAHTQGRLAARAKTFVRELSLTPDDVALTVFPALRPLFLVQQVLAMLHAGGCAVLAERPKSATFWRLYEQTRPTYGIVMPSYVRTLLDDPAAAAADHSRLRFLFSAGDQTGPELCRAVRTVTGRPLLPMFGMTETGALFIPRPGGADKRADKPGCIGRPMAGVESRLVGPDGSDAGVDEPGRLLVRSPNMMVGYWNDTLATHRAIGAGWLDTGDLARIDADGDYWFLGRAADVIVRNAVNVSSALVVEALLEHPAVEEAALVGIADPEAGQVPVAFYRVRATAEAPRAEDLPAWVAARVDTESVPVRCLRLERLPLTAQGKLDRARLVRLAEEDVAEAKQRS